jgi:serine protease Do
VALVRVPASLTPAPVADDGAMAPGRSAVVLSVAETGGGGNRLDWSRATVTSVASAAPAGSARAVDAIVVDVRTAPQVCGALLLDSRGAVVGLRGAAAGTSRRGADEFLPATLVIGVSNQLALDGTVRHGWLDLSGDDAVIGGVLVGSVDPRGAAAGMLESGDVIESISGEPVRSMAELRTRLYVLPPGASVALDVVRHGHRIKVDVQLGGSP